MSRKKEEQRLLRRMEMNNYEDRLLGDDYFSTLYMVIQKIFCCKNPFPVEKFRKVIWRGYDTWICPDKKVKKQIWKNVNMVEWLYNLKLDSTIWVDVKNETPKQMAQRHLFRLYGSKPIRESQAKLLKFLDVIWPLDEERDAKLCDPDYTAFCFEIKVRVNIPPEYESINPLLPEPMADYDAYFEPNGHASSILYDFNKGVKKNYPFFAMKEYMPLFVRLYFGEIDKNEIALKVLADNHSDCSSEHKKGQYSLIKIATEMCLSGDNRKIENDSSSSDEWEDIPSEEEELAEMALAKGRCLCHKCRLERKGKVLVKAGKISKKRKLRPRKIKSSKKLESLMSEMVIEFRAKIEKVLDAEKTEPSIKNEIPVIVKRKVSIKLLNAGFQVRTKEEKIQMTPENMKWLRQRELDGTPEIDQNGLTWNDQTGVSQASEPTCLLIGSVKGKLYISLTPRKRFKLELLPGCRRLEYSLADFKLLVLKADLAGEPLITELGGVLVKAEIEDVVTMNEDGYGEWFDFRNELINYFKIMRARVLKLKLYEMSNGDRELLEERSTDSEEEKENIERKGPSRSKKNYALMEGNMFTQPESTRYMYEWMNREDLKERRKLEEMVDKCLQVGRICDSVREKQEIELLEVQKQMEKVEIEEDQSAKNEKDSKIGKNQKPIKVNQN